MTGHEAWEDLEQRLLCDARRGVVVRMAELQQLQDASLWADLREELLRRGELVPPATPRPPSDALFRMTCALILAPPK